MLDSASKYRIRDFIGRDGEQHYRSVLAIVMEYSFQYIQLSGKKDKVARLEISLADDSSSSRLVLRLWDALATGLIYGKQPLSRGCILLLSDCRRDCLPVDHVVVRLCPERGAVRCVLTSEGELISHGFHLNPESQPATYARAEELYQWSKSITSLQLSRYCINCFSPVPITSLW